MSTAVPANRGTLSPHSYCTCWENKGRCIDCAEEQLTKAQSTIAMIQKIAGCQVDRLVSTVEELVRERGELKERVENLEELLEHAEENGGLIVRERDHWKANHDEMVRRNAFLLQRPDLDVTRIRVYEELKRDEEATRKYWSNAYYTMEAERDELKADAVRFKMHLEQKDRALAANAEEYKKLQAEFFDYTHETSKLRDRLNETSGETTKALNAGVTWMKEVESLKRERALYHHAHNCEQAHAGDNYANVHCTCGADDDMQETHDHFHRRGAEAMREAAAGMLEEWASRPHCSLTPNYIVAARAIRALPIPERNQTC